MWPLGPTTCPLALPDWPQMHSHTHTRADKDTPSRAVLSTLVRAKTRGISLRILAPTIKKKKRPFYWKAACLVGHACVR